MSRKKCSFLSFEAGVTVRCAEFSMYFLLFQVLRRVGVGGQFRLEPRLDSQVMFRFGWSAATDWLLAPPGSLDRKGRGEVSHKILRKKTIRPTSLVLNNTRSLKGWEGVAWNTVFCLLLRLLLGKLSHPWKPWSCE